MSCSTCTAIRRVVNVPLAAFNLPQFYVAPPPAVQQQANKPAPNQAWPTRR